MKELYTHNVSDIPANREVALEDSRYFTSGNLAEKIQTLAGRPDSIVEMGKNARRFVEQELNTAQKQLIFV